MEIPIKCSLLFFMENEIKSLAELTNVVTKLHCPIVFCFMHGHGAERAFKAAYGAFVMLVKESMKAHNWWVSMQQKLQMSFTVTTKYIKIESRQFVFYLVGLN